jgi:hypothetical protein
MPVLISQQNSGGEKSLYFLHISLCLNLVATKTEAETLEHWTKFLCHLSVLAMVQAGSDATRSVLNGNPLIQLNEGNSQQLKCFSSSTSNLDLHDIS